MIPLVGALALGLHATASSLPDFVVVKQAYVREGKEEEKIEGPRKKIRGRISRGRKQGTRIASDYKKTAGGGRHFFFFEISRKSVGNGVLVSRPKTNSSSIIYSTVGDCE